MYGYTPILHVSAYYSTTNRMMMGRRDYEPSLKVTSTVMHHVLKNEALTTELWWWERIHYQYLR